MTWPTCHTCRKEYIPIRALDGCPWCSGLAEVRPPGETWRERRSRVQREQRAKARLERAGLL